MAQLRPSSVETETVWGKSEAKFGPTPVRRKSKNREKYREIYEFGLRIIRFCPDFAKFPETGREIAAILGIFADKPLVANDLPWHFCSGVVTGQGINRDLASRFGAVPRLKCRSESLPPFSLAPEGELPFLSVSGHFHSAANTGLQSPLRGVLFSPVF